jgi:hypothetical protein
MMKASHLRNSDDLISFARQLCRPGNWTVLIKREMKKPVLCRMLRCVDLQYSPAIEAYDDHCEEQPKRREIITNMSIDYLSGALGAASRADFKGLFWGSTATTRGLNAQASVSSKTA